MSKKALLEANRLVQAIALGLKPTWLKELPGYGDTVRPRDWVVIGLIGPDEKVLSEAELCRIVSIFRYGSGPPHVRFRLGSAPEVWTAMVDGMADGYKRQFKKVQVH